MIVLLNLQLVGGVSKPLSPEGYPSLSSGQCWAFDPNLVYSRDWQDKGAYKAHVLSTQHKDYQFVQALYDKTAVPGYDIDQIWLLSDEGDERAFTACVDLLEKKHGSPVHKTQWKGYELQWAHQCEIDTVQTPAILFDDKKEVTSLLIEQQDGTKHTIPISLSAGGDLRQTHKNVHKELSDFRTLKLSNARRQICPPKGDRCPITESPKTAIGILRSSIHGA